MNCVEFRNKMRCVLARLFNFKFNYPLHKVQEHVSIANQPSLIFLRHGKSII